MPDGSAEVARIHIQIATDSITFLNGVAYIRYKQTAYSLPPASAFRAFTLNQIGVPWNPNASRI
jgi:hypothetical protein